MKMKRLRRPSPTVTRIGASEPIVDESGPEGQQESRQIKDRAAALQKKPIYSTVKSSSPNI